MDWVNLIQNLGLSGWVNIANLALMVVVALGLLTKGAPFIRVAAQALELALVFLKAINDGKITPEEKAEIDKEYADVKEALTDLKKK